jgi:hypothetical protein
MAKLPENLFTSSFVEKLPPQKLHVIRSENPESLRANFLICVAPFDAEGKRQRQIKRQVARELEALLTRLLKRRSPADYKPLVQSVCAAEPFSLLAAADRDRAVEGVIKKLGRNRKRVG